MGQIRVGTASWTDRTLIESGWYPPEADTPEKRLRFYARQFPLVEVDATYYALPAEQTAAAWAARTPAGFTFNVKAFSLFTQHPTRVAALPAPNERERTQWYFQRYVPHLPAAGEMVLFDRSWYNRAGVEHVMGFCTEREYLEFMQSCPEFERMLVRSGIILIKYWFSVSDEEQERRFQDRMHTPTKRWKLSPMDLESRKHWADYSRAKDEMFAVTDTKQVPWYVVNAENKKRARLNVIRHLLTIIPYKDLTPEPLKLPPILKSKYVRPPIHEQNFIPEVYV